MKPERFIFFSGVLLFTLIAGSMFSAARAEWKEVIPQQLFAEKLRIAAFHSENFGFNGGAGDIGKARFTSDAGKSWIQAESSGS